MAWDGGDPVATIDGLLRLHRDERDDAQAAGVDAHERYVAALAAEDRALADLERARRRIRAASAEIDALLEERHLIVPRPRPPGPGS